jgi:hypothetical protein
VKFLGIYKVLPQKESKTFPKYQIPLYLSFSINFTDRWVLFTEKWGLGRQNEKIWVKRSKKEDTMIFKGN